MNYAIVCNKKVVCSMTEQEAMLEFHSLQDLKGSMFEIVDDEFNKVVLINGKFVQEKANGVH